jgi:tetratricopeptide (TPR) repeat protein
VRRPASRLALTLALAACVAPSALAAPPLGGTASVADRAKARRASQEGEAKLAKGDVAGALESFMHAASIVPSAPALRQVALLHDRLGHVREAVAAYEAYVELAPQREIDEARARVAELVKTPGRVVVRGSPAGARLVVDDANRYEGLPVELELPPGEHRFRLEADGYVPYEFSIQLPFGSEATPAIDLEPETPQPPSPVLDLGHPEPVPLPAWLAAAPVQGHEGVLAGTSHPRTGAWVAAGLAAGALGAGVWFGLEALDAQSAFAARASAAEANRGELAAFRADIAFGSALLLGVAAAALFAHDESVPMRASGRLAPSTVPGSFDFGGRF